jgi:hypothetical protein
VGEDDVPVDPSVLIPRTDGLARLRVARVGPGPVSSASRHAVDFAEDSDSLQINMSDEEVGTDLNLDNMVELGLNWGREWVTADFFVPADRWQRGELAAGSLESAPQVLVVGEAYMPAGCPVDVIRSPAPDRVTVVWRLSEQEVEAVKLDDSVVAYVAADDLLGFSARLGKDGNVSAHTLPQAYERSEYRRVVLGRASDLAGMVMSMRKDPDWPPGFDRFVRQALEEADRLTKLVDDASGSGFGKFALDRLGAAIESHGPGILFDPELRSYWELTRLTIGVATGLALLSGSTLQWTT